MKRIVLGKILRVNLTKGTFSQEMVDEKDLEIVVGGRGLGALLLYKELSAGIDPLGAENKLIYTTGPLAGTNSPSGGRFLVNTKSPLTGIYLYSVSGGYFGNELRRSGFDGIIIEGKAEKPVYLYIKNGLPSIHDASEFWGLGTQITQELIKEEIRQPEARVSCIGPAGERMVPYAASINERRALGRGGVGAVMGSKNLKAVVVKGDQTPFIFDPPRFQQAIKKVFQDCKDNPLTNSTFSKGGTAAAVNMMNEVGIFPVKNHLEANSPEVWKIGSDELLKNYFVKDIACASPCPVKCSKYFVVKEGKRAGVFSEGPEYETLYALGGMIKNFDASNMIEIDAICDDLGIDTISVGVSIAFAMECYERGIITKKDTGGIELNFGNTEVLVPLLRDIAFRQGFGAVIAQGTKRMAEQFGQGSEVFAMHTKGMEMGAYDPRGAKGMALVYAVGPRGGCHHAGGYTAIPEAISGQYNPFSEGKEKIPLVANARNRRAAACDSFSMCSFVCMGVTDPTISELISSVIGIEISPEDIYIIGERISNIERMFNCREGIRRKDDTLPYRLISESVSSGPTKGKIVENLDGMLDYFYSHLGWDLKTGVPTPEKLKEMKLDWMNESV
jgi:aldehyde:ferredoxin oxidoreductase